MVTLRIGFLLAIFFLLTCAPTVLSECLTSACHSIMGKADFVHDPVASEECNFCHVATGKPHPGSKDAFDLMESGSGLCLMCHDTVGEGRNHVHSPVEDNCTGCHSPHQSNHEKFLYQPGNRLCFMCHVDKESGEHRHTALDMGCTSCHDPHAGPQPDMLQSSGNALCLECHEDPAEGQKHIHSALEMGCTSCHDPHSGAVENMLPAEGNSLCYECHESMTEGKAHVHSAVEMGCTSCHNPHAGPTENMLPSAGAELCYSCHESKSSGAVVHGPVDAGECALCHDPHASDNPSQLSEEGTGLCLMCHDSKSEAVDGEHVHPIVADGCTNCHDPHNSPNAFMLMETGDALCLMCHDDIEELKQAEYPHYALEMGCGSCHDAHGTGEMKMFVTEAGALCYLCHEDKELEIKAYKSQHQPVENGSCWACHAPHGAEREMLLKGNWPGKFYTPYSAETYSLCITCHTKNKFEYGRTSEATGFRNGDRNLHYLHVNKEKGRVCKVCHGVHGADQDNMILEKVPGFGEWSIPIAYSSSATGGACLAGCHQPMYYDREQRISNR